jgi:hypothetical protein
LAFDLGGFIRIVMKVDDIISVQFYIPANELGINFGSRLAAAIDCDVAIRSEDRPFYIKVSATSLMVQDPHGTSPILDDDDKRHNRFRWEGISVMGY